MNSDHESAHVGRSSIRALIDDFPMPSAPVWSPAEDAELLYRQLVERAASSLVLGDEGLAADYLALIPRPPMPPLRGARTDLLLTFGRAVLAAERLRDSRTDY